MPFITQNNDQLLIEMRMLLVVKDCPLVVVSNTTAIVKRLHSDVSVVKDFIWFNGGYCVGGVTSSSNSSGGGGGGCGSNRVSLFYILIMYMIELQNIL